MTPATEAFSADGANVGAARVRWAERSESLAAGLVLLPISIVAIATVGFAAGSGMQAWYGPAATVLVLGFLFYSALRQRGEAWVRGAALLGILGISLCLGGLLGDLSFDSLNYHQPAVAELAGGWNPWTSPSPGSFGDNGVWLNHFPQASWINAASATMVTGRIDTGKWVNFALAASAGLAVFALLLRSTLATRRMSAVMAILVAANPVTLCQVSTFYLDGTLGATVTVLVVGLGIVIVQRRNSGWWLAAPALLLLMNLKHSGVAYAVIMCGVAVAASCWSRGWREALRLGFTLLGLGIAGLFFIGYAPYGKNLRAGLHVFHPVLGKRMMDDFMGSRKTPNLPANRIGAFVVSHFAASDYPEHIARPAVAKFPLMIGLPELAPWYSTDVKTGGFGPWYGALMIFSAGGFVALACRRRDARFGVALWVGAGVCIGIFCHDQGWWARYAPQAWLLVWIVPVVALDLPGRAWRTWRACILFLGVVNCSIILVVSAVSQSGLSRRLDRCLTEAAEAAPVALQVQRFPIIAERFKERGIPFVLLEGEAGPGAVRHPIVGQDPVCYWIKAPAPK